MTEVTPTPAYLAALRSYLQGAEESALLWAYERGRDALESGIGVLELGTEHRDVVASLIEEAKNGAEAARIFRETWAFFAETAAPVEMCLRGYQQSNESLRTLAATLDDQVRERTRDLDASLDDLKRVDRERQVLLERLMTAQEDERRRIAGDIHDDSIQVVTAAYLRVELIRQALGESPHAETLAKLDEALRAAIDRLRHLVFELRPATLDSAGLAATVREHLEQWGRQAEVEYRFVARLESEPDAAARTTLYRIAGEALANVRKHARATHVDVELEEHDDGYILRVSDDGVGIRNPRAAGDHFGVSMMGERAGMAGGWCRVQRRRHGRGTTVTVWVPAAGGTCDDDPQNRDRGAEGAADPRVDR